MTDIIDRIDELVDEQLADGEPENGYDFGDPDYPECPHCGRHWHGLRITRRIEAMRWAGHFDPEYRYADDDSPVLCEGSEFIGPMPPPVWLTNVAAVRIEPDVRGLAEYFTQAAERWRGMFQQIAEAFAPVVDMTLWMPHTHDQMAPRLGVMHGAPWIQFNGLTALSGHIAFDELHRCTKPTPVPEDISIRFGPENWIHEIRRIPPELQFPRPYPRLIVSPAEWEAHAHWTQFTAPNYPIPDRPGYDFSRYAHDDQEPIWAPRADVRPRATTRPAHTHGRHRTRGRTRR
ncbi:hypothetical protein [Mycolicibacterium mageritense]|nr:hypothetical protein [Mycolicibacterium mageritense]